MVAAIRAPRSESFSIEPLDRQVRVRIPLGSAGIGSFHRVGFVHRCSKGWMPHPRELLSNFADLLIVRQPRPPIPRSGSSKLLGTLLGKEWNS